MNRKDAKKLWPIVKAFGEGKRITYEGSSTTFKQNIYFSAVAEKYSILPDKKVVDLQKVVGSNIPMVFSTEDAGNVGTAHCYLRELHSDGGASDIDGCVYDLVEFDTSENNWVSWGPHVPNYDDKSPLPEGVRYEILFRDGETCACPMLLSWYPTGSNTDSDIIAYHVLGLLDDYCYEHDAEVTE